MRSITTAGREVLERRLLADLHADVAVVQREALDDHRLEVAVVRAPPTARDRAPPVDGRRARDRPGDLVAALLAVAEGTPPVGGIVHPAG